MSLRRPGGEASHSVYFPSGSAGVAADKTIEPGESVWRDAGIDATALRYAPPGKERAT